MEGQGYPEKLGQATYHYTLESYKIKTATTFDPWLSRHGSDKIEQHYRTWMGPDGNVPLRPLVGGKIQKVSSEAPLPCYMLW